MGFFVFNKKRLQKYKKIFKVRETNKYALCFSGLRIEMQIIYL